MLNQNTQLMKNNLVNFKTGVSGKPKLITLDELKKMKLDSNQDYYTSIFKYNNTHKELAEKSGSVAGITDVTTDTLVWDFDSKTNLEQCRQDVLTLANNLVQNYNVPADGLECFYSSQKGFHVVLKLDKTITQPEFKQAVTKLAGHLETFDPVVSDPARIIRLPNTKNPKSGLYKIPLHIADVEELTIDQIKELAKSPKEPEFVPTIVSLPKELFVIPKKEVKTNITADSDFDFLNPPRGWKVYKNALLMGWFESGERHMALMIIAATCRGLGYTKDQTYFLCKSALKNQAARTGEPEFNKTELYENIVESVFGKNWDGGQFGIDHPLIQKICKRLNIDLSKDSDNIVQLHNIEEEFIDFVKNIDKNTILTGIRELDEKLPLTIGMNLGIIGAASSGKTALALKILENTSQAEVVSVFASLDMRRNRLFEKLLYRLSGLSRIDLYTKIQKGEAMEIFQLVRDKYKNVYFYDRSCPSVEDIRGYITAIEEKTGKKVKLVMLDYFERVNAERSDDTAASKEVSGKLQDLVNDFNVCLITLVQPNKFSLSGGPDSPILNYTAIKGSSFLYQSFRSIISIWRPFFSPELKQNDKFLQMAILKNDLGELDMLNFGWEGKRGEIWGLGEEGQEELERLLDEKEDKKNNKTSSSNDGWQ